MESLSDEVWDVVIAGTSLPQSLLALSLSKCDLKVLHVDQNEYYGGVDAGLSLDEAQKWVQSRNASEHDDDAIITSDTSDSGLGPPRAYTISLNPQIIYAKSKFLPTLVSSQIHSQLEFQAVGSFWTFTDGKLQKIPSNREDVFADDTLSVRDKRRLMGLLRYVLEEKDEVSEDTGTLEARLQDQFNISDNLRPPVQALTLSTSTLASTRFDTAMSRLRRHLSSMGYFGPGLAAVIAKYGSNSEIAQVACRAGAVGGFTYLLGHGIDSVNVPPQQDALVEVRLSDGTKVKAKQVFGMQDDFPTDLLSDVDRIRGPDQTTKVAHRISIVSDPLRQLFISSSDTGPQPAVAVVLVDDGETDQPPVYLQVHSEETGECPTGQCIIYASTLNQSLTSQERLSRAIDDAISMGGAGASDTTSPANLLWTMSYITREAAAPTPWNYHLNSDTSQKVTIFPDRTYDIAFDDTILENVRAAWQSILGERSAEYDFLRFEERQDSNGDD